MLHPWTFLHNLQTAPCPELSSLPFGQSPLPHLFTSLYAVGWRGILENLSGFSPLRHVTFCLLPEMMEPLFSPKEMYQF